MATHSQSHNLDSSDHGDTGTFTKNTGELLAYNSAGSLVSAATGTEGQFLITSGGNVGLAWINTAGAGGNHALDSGSHTDVNAITEATGMLLAVGSDGTWYGVATGALGQILISSAGATNYNLAWVNTTDVAGSAVVYAPTGVSYITLDADATLTAEQRLVQSGNNITISTDGTTVVISATTADISGKQDSITFPLITGSGGTGLSAEGSGGTFLRMQTDGSGLEYGAIAGSDNITVVSRGSDLFLSANTADITGKQDNISFPLITGSGGTGLSSEGSGGSLLGVETGGTGLEYKILAASNNMTIRHAGSSIFLEATTGVAVTYAPTGASYITIAAEGGLSGERTLQAGANITLSSDATTVTVAAETGGGAAHDLDSATHTNVDAISESTGMLLAVNSAGNWAGFGTGGLGQVLISSGGLEYTLAWVNTTDTTGTGVVYAPTGAPYITLAANNTLTAEQWLVQSGNSITITTDGTVVVINAATPDVSGFQESVSFPLGTNSGGTGLDAIGSGGTFLHVQTGGAALEYGAITASDNIVLAYRGSDLFISASTNTAVTYAATGNQYIVIAGAGDLTAERTLEAGDSISITSDATTVTINATTTGPHTLDSAIHTDVDTISESTGLILVVNSAGNWAGFGTGGPGQVLVSTGGVEYTLAWVNTTDTTGSGSVYAATGNQYVVLSLSTDLSAEQRLVQSGNSIIVVTDGTTITINATTNPAITYAATGNQYVVLAGAAGLTAERVLTASTGLTLTDLGANNNVLLSVNTNVRDKAMGFFAAGTISPVMRAASAAIYIPYNMRVQNVRVAMGISASNPITLTLVQYNNVMKASTTMLANANTIRVVGVTAVGSDTGTFNTPILYAGSHLGYKIMSTGAATFGQDMTLTVIARAS